jgi:hypothetical protein
MIVKKKRVKEGKEKKGKEVAPRIVGDQIQSVHHLHHWTSLLLGQDCLGF